MKRKEYIYRLCNLLGSQGKFKPQIANIENNRHKERQREEKKKKTCAEDAKELVILRGEFENLKHDSGESVNENRAAVEYKILTEHCNDLASLRSEKRIN